MGEIVVRQEEGLIYVRSSSDPDATPLVFTASEWWDFLRGVKAGEFDV